MALGGQEVNKRRKADRASGQRMQDNVGASAGRGMAYLTSQVGNH